MCADIDNDIYDVSAQIKSDQAAKLKRMTELSPTPTFDKVKAYLADGTTKFAEMREATREQTDLNMLRQLAKTLAINATWELDMGDLMILPKHTCQLHWWAEVDKPPTTTYTVRPVKITALAFMEIAGNSIITVLP